jgi:hypothetical protein
MNNNPSSVSNTTKKTGRSLKPIDPRAMELAAARGLNRLDSASELGVSQATLTNRLKADAVLSDAYRRGLARAGSKPRSSSKKAAPARRGRQSPAPRPAGEPSAEPASPAVKVDREEDAKVFAALKAGPRCRQELKEETGYGYDVINDALYRLRFDRRLVGSVTDKLNKEFFFILGDEEKAEARVKAASGGGPEAPPPPPQVHEPRVVSETRLARTVGAIKGATEQTVRALPDSNGDGHAATIPESVPPPVHAPESRPEQTALREQAVRAALVEFGFIEFWGAPSNRFDDSRSLLLTAFGTFRGEVGS